MYLQNPFAEGILSRYMNWAGTGPWGQRTCVRSTSEGPQCAGWRVDKQVESCMKLAEYDWLTLLPGGSCGKPTPVTVSVWCPPCLS